MRREQIKYRMYFHGRKCQDVYLCPAELQSCVQQALEWCLLPTAPSDSAPVDHVQTHRLSTHPTQTHSDPKPHWPQVSSQRQQLSPGWRSYTWGASQSACLQLENPKVPHGLRTTRWFKSSQHKYGVAPSRGVQWMCVLRGLECTIIYSCTKINVVGS